MPQPVKELLGFNLKVARLRAGLSQSDTAGRMKKLGFKDWRRQTVGNSENGGRRVTVEELAGLALVLGVAPGRLLWPENGESPVSLPSGFAFPGVRLVMNDGSVEWAGEDPVAGPTKARVLPADKARELPPWLFGGDG
jgi:transcriptional regulator with XRE-family HTH domain